MIDDIKTLSTLYEAVLNNVPFQPSPELKKAIGRRNVDFRNGRLTLVNGTDPTPENAIPLIQQTQKRINDREDIIKRLNTLPDDASVQEVRATIGIGDSRAVNKSSEIRVWQSYVDSGKQYIDDMKLAVKEYTK